MDKTNQDKDFSDLIENLKSKFGEGAIMRLGDQKFAKTETIPSGSFALDLALGVGGLPRGRTIEIYGPEMSGKSTLTLHAIAELQKKTARRPILTPNTLLILIMPKNWGSKPTISCFPSRIAAKTL